MDIPLARTRLDLVAMVLMIGYAVLLCAVVAGVVALLEGTALLVVLLVLVVAWLVHVGLYLYSWARIRGVASPLGLHGDGLHERTPFGEVVAPWEAIRVVTLEQRLLRSPLLRIRLVEPGDPRRTTVNDSSANPGYLTAIDKRGIRWSLRVLDISVEQLRQAFVVQSGGRIQISLGGVLLLPAAPPDHGAEQQEGPEGEQQRQELLDRVEGTHVQADEMRSHSPDPLTEGQSM